MTRTLSPSLRRLQTAGAAALLILSAACSTPPPPPPPPAYVGPALQIQQIERGVQIVLPSLILFEVGQARLESKAADPYLDRISDLLMRKTDKRVAVEGHTDSDGSGELNDGLSKARAQAVAMALNAHGIPSSRMDIQGFSFNRPVASNATEEGKRLNRRVEIIILDETLATITSGEAPSSFQQAWRELKSLVESGAVKPVEGSKP